MTINHSRVVGNSAPDDTKGNKGAGGGILNINFSAPGSPIPDSGVLIIDDSRISRNSTSAKGGGILNNIPSQLPASLTINRSHVTENTAHSGGGIFNAGGPVSLRFTAVRHNHPDNCQPIGSVAHRVLPALSAFAGEPVRVSPAASGSP
ncbi:hypothetical protein [Streptacidiphilus rugosus]|uniref:hypothetical protein n=1 Tax=Streptacidiphilus rugosus TaxID=405783 RepID=UPI00055D28D5|nr:hypothetical protein [Streptacidiphilus rugosus]